MNKLLFLLPLLSVFSGCANSGGYKVINDTAEIPPIQQRLSNQLSKLEIGSSLEEFLQQFPEAYVGGQHGKTSAYEVTSKFSYVTPADIDRQNYIWGFGSPNARTSSQVLWFYFHDNKLVKWGRPQDWPGTTSLPEIDKQGKEKSVCSGTGFAISEDGHIVTAYHVIKDAKTIKVYFLNDSFVSARVVQGDPVNDLALLKIETSTPNFLQIAPMRSAKTGTQVFTLGFPVSSVLGREAKYTEGVISSLSGIKDATSFLQITVPIQPGNSGGPLVNDKGEVVGIITSTAAILPFVKESGTLPQNVSWAVKADYLRPLIELPKAEQKELNREQLIEHVKNSTFFIEAE